MVANKDIFADKLIRLTLVVAIAAWAFQLLYPLLGILAWGFILAVVLYPFYAWVNRCIGKRPILASTIVILSSLIPVIGIAIFVTNDIAHTVGDMTTRIQSHEKILIEPPAMIQRWPLFGEKLYEVWTSLSENLETAIKEYSDTLLLTGKFALVKIAETSKDFILFIVSIIFSGFLLAYHAPCMAFIRKLSKRIARDNGTDFINLTRETIQNVCRGVIGIALLQAFIFWIILLIAGTPGSGFLSLLALIFCIAQLGLVILVIPIIIWLFFTKAFVLAVTLAVLLILDTLLDGFLKPVVLARGLSTPMIIIFTGVISGILVYGLIGVFIGPVVLAIAYDLMRQWIAIEV